MNRLPAMTLGLLLILGLLFPGRAAANWADDLITWTNNVRARHGLPPLTNNVQLNNAAFGHARNMAAQQTMVHNLDGRGPGERITAAGYAWMTYGENVAYNRGYEDPANAAMLSWVKSPGHLANILNPNVVEIGVAWATAADGTVYFCQVFGAR